MWVLPEVLIVFEVIDEITLKGWGFGLILSLCKS
jgi:hypothetical protein